MISFLRFGGKGAVCDGSGGKGAVCDGSGGPHCGPSGTGVGFGMAVGGGTGSGTGVGPVIAVGGGTGIVLVPVSSGMTTWSHESHTPPVSGVLVSGGGYLSAIVVTFWSKVTVFLRLAVSRGVPGLAA